MKKICLLWDFDGTLAYRDGMWTQSMCNILESNGYIGFDREKISLAMLPHYPWEKHDLAHNEYFGELSWWGYIQKKVVGNALSEIGIYGKENHELANQFRKEYLKLDAWYLFDDTLRNLERSTDLGYENAILSNHTPELCMLAEYLGIDKYFKHIITSADLGYEKPNSNFFDIIQTFGDYDAYYMIGDNYEADIKGALNYGIKAIMVRKPNVEEYQYYSDKLDGAWQFIK